MAFQIFSDQILFGTTCPQHNKSRAFSSKDLDVKETEDNGGVEPPPEENGHPVPWMDGTTDL